MRTGMCAPSPPASHLPSPLTRAPQLRWSTLRLQVFSVNGAVCDQSSCGVWIIVLGALVCDWACEAHVPGRRTQPVDVYLTQQLLSRYGVVDAGEPNAPSHCVLAESNKAFIISQRTVLGQQLQHADIGLPYVLLPRGRRQSATVDALSTPLCSRRTTGSCCWAGRRTRTRSPSSGHIGRRRS